jgi:L-seryl-tRNA(Ser) seleniumtransferase
MIIFMSNNLLSGLPNMNSILSHELLESADRERVKRAGQELLDELRVAVLSKSLDKIPQLDECAKLVLKKLDEYNITNLRGLINATGVVLHTNLGRAPLGNELYAEVADVFQGYSNLEYDLESGKRGSRHSHVENLICELTGAESAMVVNNNAAAVLLMLAALAKGKRVAVSRGELVEIGGSFRVPEIMAQSRAKLKEVGTTNRTRLSDYVNAVETEEVEVLLKVHTSNYEIIGFTESTSLAELAQYGASVEIPVLYDMGSCFLINPELLGLLAGETAREAVEAGADVICFSGDKLIGATQAGILAGRKKYIDKMKKHPFARAIRADKLTLSALECILRLYRFPLEAKRRIPTLRMLSETPQQLREHADSLANQLHAILPDWKIEVVETGDETGGGSLPNVVLPGFAVALEPKNTSVTQLEQRLRHGSPPIISRIYENKLLLSVRTVLPGEYEKLVNIFKNLV